MKRQGVSSDAGGESSGTPLFPGLDVSMPSRPASEGKPAPARTVAAPRPASSRPVPLAVPAAAPAAAPAERPQRRAITVRELVGRLQATLAERFPQRFWVEGELSNVKAARNGHTWCCLKDGDAQLEAVIWRDDVRQLPFSPAEGMHVLALVRRIDLYGPTGRLRITIERLEPQGIGALYRALEERKKRFEAEGLFAAERKRPLPFLPRAVGVATASTGAAVRDVLEVLAQRFAARRVVVRPCKVQGDGAAADIAAALDDLNRDGTVDVIIVGRGGGSIEDLWAFNEEVVVRAIARSRIPVISAVGHETDTTLADYVADLRAPTPSAAAALVMPERRELDETLARLRARLERALVGRVERMRGRLVSADKVLADPRRLVTERQLRLESLARRAREAMRSQPRERRHRLERLRTRLGARVPSTEVKLRAVETLGRRMLHAFERRLVGVRHDVTASASRLDALSPLAVLGRGFTLARKADGRVVRDCDEIVAGERLALRFARGEANVEVLDTSPDGGPAADPSRRGR
jgi:exodeoxyribonuclease VII large subunit